MAVYIGADDIYTMRYYNVWAVIPSAAPLQELFLARENLNGILVLATCKSPERDL